MKVYIPQAVAKEGTDYLLEHGYEIKEGTGFSPEEMARDIADCDAMLIRTAQCPKEVVDAAKHVKIIARHGVGFDNIDIKEAETCGIWVTNTPQALSDSVAEYTLSALLMAAKNIRDCSNAMYRGEYAYKNSHKGLDVGGKKLGVVGFGRIGRAVAKKAYYGLDMEILAYDPFVKQEQAPEYVTMCSWEALFSGADFISLHLPGGEANRNAVGAKEFEMMKDDACLINAARGGIVNEEALYVALSEHKIRSACFDVYSSEPPKADDKLVALDNFLLTPHTAARCKESERRTCEMSSDIVMKQLLG